MGMREDADGKGTWLSGWGKDRKIARRQRRAIRKRKAVAEALDEVGREKFGKPSHRFASERNVDPPSGWYVFGTHAGWSSDDIPRLEFSGEDEAGMPLFERPVADDGLRERVWDEALRWVRQQAEVTSPEYVLDRIDRAEPFNPYRRAVLDATTETPDNRCPGCGHDNCPRPRGWASLECDWDPTEAEDDGLRERVLALRTEMVGLQAAGAPLVARSWVVHKIDAVLDATTEEGQ